MTARIVKHQFVASSEILRRLNPFCHTAYIHLANFLYLSTFCYIYLHLFIPLDIFQKSMHNKPIRNKLEAWLTFLSSDAPETIASLIEQFPEFEPLYMDIYEICQNTERIMGLFSKELEIMDLKAYLAERGIPMRM